MRKILVTGSNKGLGLEIARKLLKKEFTVISTGRAITKDIEKLLRENKNRFFFEEFDLNNKESIKFFVKDLHEKFGIFYGLVNNAAVGNDGVLATMHEKDIAQTITVNLESQILLTKYIIRGMLKKKEGKIVNISSIIASTGYNGLSVYGATKAAIIGFTKSLSRELGKVGIYVNCVSPGFMETNMTQNIDKQNLEKIMRRSPMKELAKSEEVAEVVNFLMSEGSNSITGEEIIVDKGSTA